jgi:hypothetical protein
LGAFYDAFGVYATREGVHGRVEHRGERGFLKAEEIGGHASGENAGYRQREKDLISHDGFC